VCDSFCTLMVLHDVLRGGAYPHTLRLPLEYAGDIPTRIFFISLAALLLFMASPFPLTLWPNYDVVNEQCRALLLWSADTHCRIDLLDGTRVSRGGCKPASVIK
jgi:hypothetical protein